MSDLPEIDFMKVEEKLLVQLVEQHRRAARLEVLAETLLDQRDTARAERDYLKRQLEKSTLDSEEV